MGAPLDLTNKRFGRLLVIERSQNRIMGNGDSRRAWLCKCECGNEIVATTQDLRKGDVRSCGCLKRDLDIKRVTTHGDHSSHLHNVWCAMRRRCRNRNNKDFSHYGGRGIQVCAEWDSNFLCFKEWALSNGYAEGLTIDRIDVDGNYKPENCRWISMKEQSNNRSNSRYITHNGETHTIQEWSEILDIPYTTLYMRFRNGWSADKALNKK